MYRGQSSNTEVDDIWHEKGKYKGKPQSQQLQMVTEGDSPVGITSDKDVRGLKNTHSPHLAMHFSMEYMILNQSDLIWEHCILSAYTSYYSSDIWPLFDVTNVNNYTCNLRVTSDIAPIARYEHHREPCKASDGDIRFSNFNGIFAAQAIRNSYIPGAINKKEPRQKRKLSVQLDGTEKSAKRSMIIKKCDDMSPYFMDLCEKKNADFMSCITIETKAEDRYVKPCHTIEASSVKNMSMPTLRTVAKTCCNVRPGCKMSDDGCYFGSVLKSLVISSSSLGVTEEVFSSTFIPQTDSSVDYTMQCGSLQQKGRCKVPSDSDESLCLTNNTDSNINLHVRLSAHPCILTSDIILRDVNCSEPGERQGQNWERRRIWDEMVIAANILKSSPQNKLSLVYTDKQNRHCANNDKSFLPRGKTFSTRLNYSKQHFLQDIGFSIFAASLLGTSRNDFPFFHNAVLQSASPTESSHETTDESFLLKQGLTYEEAEVEVSLGTENINNSTGKAHLAYKSALNKQDFCFPSHFQKKVVTEQSEKETSGNNVDFCIESTCSEQVSHTERFHKVCLEKSESSKHFTEIHCSFRNEMLLYKSRSRQDNMVTIEYKPSECQNIKQPHKHQSCTKDAKDKEHNEEVQSGNMNSEATHHHNTGDSSNVIEEVDMTFNKLDSKQEEGQYENLYVLDEPLNGSFVSSVCVEATVNEKCRQKCDPLTEIKGEASVVVTEENMDASSSDSKELVYNADFRMKAQFDLVLEELKMFHTIDEENIENETEQENRLEATCTNTQEDGINENFPSNKEIVGGELEVLVTKKDHICDRETTKVREQEVPQQCISYNPGGEESLYSADNADAHFTEDIPKSSSWTPAFVKSIDREANITSYTEKVTFSHGIGRVTPLKTRTGPLRIGLSKKAKIKQLHPYLR
ncbi:RAD51-associated protein 2 isoform X2 [Eleutherodactylus coqui]|uniref:RAD51-associated protein 2 isoform X2 n=1 Tax=Eleutherodactylus coqui TaxID=57060 RepID=UPI003463104F